jgi:hypothetical protein
MSAWAVLCGALASGSLRWQAEDLLLLAMVVLLVELGWGRLWDLVVGTDWLDPGLPAPSSPPTTTFVILPYSRPGSLGWRLFEGLHLCGFWWRQMFWPAFGPVLLGILAATALTVVLVLLLPERLGLLSTALASLVGLGLLWRLRQRAALAVQAGAQIGLSWLAGHAALVDVNPWAFAPALLFSGAVWGVLRGMNGVRGGSWLLYGGQVGMLALLVMAKQPLAVGLIGLLAFGQAAQQISPAPGKGAEAAPLDRRIGLWLAAGMLVAALALP